MTITEEECQRIEHCFPIHRGNVKLSNLEVLNAILYVAENGCKWRSLPKQFGPWHTVYMRMSRWARAGVLDRVFTALQEEEIIRIRVEALSRNSTGAENNTARSPSDAPAADGAPRFIWLPQMIAER